MQDFKRYVVLDSRTGMERLEMECLSDEVAIREFCVWYNILVRYDRWEHRRLGRYVLCEELPELGSDGLPEWRAVFPDENVRLSWDYARMCDPPYDEASWDRLVSELERLDAIDVERLAGKPANVFMEHLDERPLVPASERRSGTGEQESAAKAARSGDSV